MSKHRQWHGSKHWNAVFDDDTVREIRAAREVVPTPSINALAEKYHTSIQTIRNLVNGKSYKDVE